MSRASDIFNALPREIRIRAIPSANELEILSLEREKTWLASCFRKRRHEINERIAGIQKVNVVLLGEISREDGENSPDE